MLSAWLPRAGDVVRLLAATAARPHITSGDVVILQICVSCDQLRDPTDNIDETIPEKSLPSAWSSTLKLEQQQQMMSYWSS